MSHNINEKCLIVRHFPTSFSENDIRDFMQMFDPIDLNIFPAQHTAIVEFDSVDHARNILVLLHQEILDENRLSVEYAPKNHGHIAMLCSEVNKSTQMTHNQSNSDDVNQYDNTKGICKTLKRLYATADDLNFEQPPPPHLHYEYPKVNRDIIDAISIALECVPKFYTQVLHLMNRMNLEPPFVPGDKHLVYESVSCQIQFATVATQTDEIIWQNLLRNKRKFIESDESELETSNSSDDGKTNAHHTKSKRKKPTQNNVNKHELLKQKQRNLLKMQRLQKKLESIEKTTCVQTKIDDAFDLDKNHKKSCTIKIVVPEQLDATASSRTNETTESISLINTHETSLNKSDNNTDIEKRMESQFMNLNENRIPAEQLNGHPMFQNYSAGEISNRLYIKNIAKDVTDADLRAIYNRYLEVNCGGHGNVRSIDIRLMKSGRMKGQAFITFDGPYLNCDVDDETSSNLANKYQIIEKALRETNGLILKGKPLVVVYGKKK